MSFLKIVLTHRRETCASEALCTRGLVYGQQQQQPNSIVPIESGTQREVGELECPLLRNGKPTTLSSLEKSAQKSTRRERKSTKVVVPSKVVQNSILLPQFARDHRQTSSTVSCLIQGGGVGYIKGKRSKRELDTRQTRDGETVHMPQQ